MPASREYSWLHNDKARRAPSPLCCGARAGGPNRRVHASAWTRRTRQPVAQARCRTAALPCHRTGKSQLARSGRGTIRQTRRRLGRHGGAPYCRARPLLTKWQGGDCGARATAFHVLAPRVRVGGRCRVAARNVAPDTRVDGIVLGAVQLVVRQPRALKPAPRRAAPPQTNREGRFCGAAPFKRFCCRERSECTRDHKARACTLLECSWPRGPHAPVLPHPVGTARAVTWAAPRVAHTGTTEDERERRPLFAPGWMRTRCGGANGAKHCCKPTHSFLLRSALNHRRLSARLARAPTATRGRAP